MSYWWKCLQVMTLLVLQVCIISQPYCFLLIHDRYFLCSRNIRQVRYTISKTLNRAFLLKNMIDRTLSLFRYILRTCITAAAHLNHPDRHKLPKSMNNLYNIVPTYLHYIILLYADIIHVYNLVVNNFSIPFPPFSVIDWTAILIP